MQFRVSIVRRKFISDVEKKPLFGLITSRVMQLQQPSVRVTPWKTNSVQDARPVPNIYARVLIVIVFKGHQAGFTQGLKKVLVKPFILNAKSKKFNLE